MTETRWLNAAEQRAWRAYIESSKVLFDALDRELQRDANMPHAYYEILVRLSEADGRAPRVSAVRLALSRARRARRPKNAASADRGATFRSVRFA